MHAGDGVEELSLIRAVPVRHWGRWVSAAFVALMAAMMAHGLITNANFHWDVVFDTLFKPQIFEAIGWTLILTVAAMVIGITLAITLAIMRRSDNPVLRWVSMAYIWFFRGTPVYTQLIFWGLIGVLYPRLSLGIPFGLDTEARTEALRRTGAFDVIDHKIVPWQLVLSADETVALYATYSDMAARPNMDAVLEELGRIAREEFGDRVERNMTTSLFVARRGA